MIMNTTHTEDLCTLEVPLDGVNLSSYLRAKHLDGVSTDKPTPCNIVSAHCHLEPAISKLDCNEELVQMPLGASSSANELSNSTSASQPDEKCEKDTHEASTQTNSSSQRPADKPQERRHIMLSYNKISRAIAMKVKDHLIARGHQVWMDVEQITSDSTLEAMGRAIENSLLMLMFYSSTYKHSINCRTEAEYAFERRVRIIPVQAELNYTADGWLGMIIGTKYRYQLANSCKYEQDLKALLNNVDKIAESARQVPVKLGVNGNPPTVETHGASALDAYEQPKSNKQKADLLNFSKEFKERLAGVDEATMKDLAMILNRSPSLFYEIISKDNFLDLLKFHQLIKSFTGTEAK
ncbi:uncharacterized protein [Watersipora subatra]|uniref:uncharacterized protein isoform X2 n=1 Tax=Watersipora subatra TaxID=2589382 RepID=UPI00355B13E4